MSLFDTFNAWAQSLVDIGIAHFAQTAILAAVLLVIDLSIGRRMSPLWRSSLWLLLFIKLLLPPQLALPTSPTYWFTPAAGNEEAGTVALGEIPIGAGLNQWDEAMESSSSASLDASDDQRADRIISWQLVLVSLWIIISGMLIVIGWRRYRDLKTMLGRSSPPPSSMLAALERSKRIVGVRRFVALRMIQQDQGPLVFGLRRPTIYLSASYAKRLSDEQIEAALVHELYHVRRGDLWIAAIQTTLRALFFYHPIVWWATRHHARLREFAIDQAVLSHRDISRQTYSMALLEAARTKNASIRSYPFALGVISQQSQLEHRIKMNLHQPRLQQSRLGLAGLCSIVMLALLLVPMMPGERPTDGIAPRTAPSSAFAEIPAGPLAERIGTTTTAIIRAFNRRDAEAYIGSFVDEAVVLGNGIPLVSGISGVGQMYMQSPPDLLYDSIVSTDQRIAQYDNLIIETGLAAFRFRLSAEAPVLTDPRQYLTIWEDTGGASLKVKLISWNALADPSKLERENEPIAFQRSSNGRPMSDATKSVIQNLETEIHEAFEAQEFEAAAEFYGENATLIVPGHSPLYGRSAISDYFNLLAPHEIATSVERQIVSVEGTEDLVIVINVFRWTFEPPEAEKPVSIPGKGIHIWERDRDGEWRLLWDLPNPSQGA